MATRKRIKKFTLHGLNIGVLGKDGVFRKEVKESKHLFRKTDSWGFDFETLNSLPFGTPIEISDSETLKTYSSTKEECIREGQSYHFMDNRDHGLQIFVPRSFFVVTEPSQEEKQKMEYMKYF